MKCKRTDDDNPNVFLLNVDFNKINLNFPQKKSIKTSITSDGNQFDYEMQINFFRPQHQLVILCKCFIKVKHFISTT